MNDAEWDQWKATWNQADGAMPDVLERARSDRRKAVLRLVVLHVIGAANLSFVVWFATRHPGWLGLVTPLIMAAVTIALIAGFHHIMRSTWDEASTPLTLLDALDKRNRARLRLGRFAGWMMGITIGATIAGVTAAMVATGRFAPGLAAMTLVCGASSALFAAVVVRRARRKIERDLDEVREARQLLRESRD
jgi:hypothetical protein